MAFSLTVKEAAQKLGVTVGRVHQLIDSGALSAEKLGRQWLVDEASVEARIAEHPRPGRPSEKRVVAGETYTLMNRAHEILRFSYDRRTGKFIEVLDVLDASRAPLSLISLRGTKASLSALSDWWRHRAIPVSRQGMHTKLKELGFADSGQIPFESLGLSLSDQYWVRPEGMDIRWQDVNFFANPFPDMDLQTNEAGIDWLSDVGLLTPDNTSEGELPKRWVRRDGVPSLLKGSGPLGQEPYNEVVATALYRRLLDPGDYVPYKLENVSAGAISCCADFLTDQEEYIPAYYVMHAKRKPNHFSEYQHYVDCCARLGADGAADALDKMIVCDDLLANHDRHWRNFGLIRDVETLSCRVAPLFDSGSSLWCDKDDEALLHGDYSFNTKPFHEQPNRQLRLVGDLSWFDPASLDGFAEEARTILSGNPALSRRLDVICEGIQHRIDRLIRMLQ